MARQLFHFMNRYISQSVSQSYESCLQKHENPLAIASSASFSSNFQGSFPTSGASCKEKNVLWLGNLKRFEFDVLIPAKTIHNISQQ